MAWIESHQALGHHPKTLQLAAELKCSVPAAVGHLQFLWWWALDFAPSGDIRATPTVVARACEWRGNPERFWQALLESGFIDTGIDGRFTVHDWLDYAGRLVAKRAANRERMRSARATHVQGLPTVPTVPTNQPEPTGPDQPNPPNPPSDRRMGGDELETCPECELLVSRDGVGHGLSRAAGRVRNCSLDGLRPYQWSGVEVTA